MNAPARILTFLFFAGSLVAGATVAFPDWPTTAGVDCWNLPALNNHIDNEMQESERLDARCEAALRSVESKTVIAHDLVEGRTSLAEAACQFRDLSAHRPDLMQGVRSIHRDMTDDERFCRCVIAYVRAELHIRAGAADDELGCLIEEMESLRQEDGSVRLPEEG